MKYSKIIIVGLGSIGKNLAEYLILKNYKINVWDRDFKKLKNFTKKNKLNNTLRLSDLLIKNCIVVLAINAGKNVDDFLKKNIKYLKRSQILIDLGNNHPDDTIKRFYYLQDNKINYINPGFSGGVEGAKGKASLMISCKKSFIKNFSKFFLDISGNNYRSLKLVGEKIHAGNYVKIIHNSIEYAIMQSIADYFFILKKFKNLSSRKILIEIYYLQKKISNFYLLEIAKDIIKKKNNLENILDAVDDNNTGAWATQLCMTYKFPAHILHTSVDARYFSRSKRIFRSFEKRNKKFEIRNFTKALILNIKLAYAQGLGLLDKINIEEKLKINFKNVNINWHNYSIIRSSILKEISFYTKKNEFNHKLFVKKIFTSKAIKVYLKTLNELSNNNLYPSTFFSVGVWIFHSQQIHYLSFSMIQKMRNTFGNHEIKFKN